MKLLVSTASLDDVRWAASAGLLDGVYTTPGLLADATLPREQIVALAHLGGVPVHVSVHAVVSGGVHREAREIARLHDQIIVRVPLVEDVVGTMHRLRADGVRVAADFVITPAQAILAARAGATAVVTPLSAVNEAGLAPAGILGEIRAALDAAHAECDLIAEGPSTAAELSAAVVAGADAVTATPALLRAALVHPSTDRCVERLLRDVARHPQPWGVE